MILRTLALSVIIFLSLTLPGQQTNDKMTYRHMEGSTDSSKMKANLLRQQEQVSGNYEIADTEETTTYEMYGKIDDANQVELNPYGSDHPILQGILVDEKFTGIWKRGNLEENIELIESYPPGSIPLSVHYLHSEENLVENNPQSPTAEIELTLLFPLVSSHTTPEVTRLIEEVIAGHYVENSEILHPDSILVKAEQEFYSLYRENEDGWQDTEWSFSWTQQNDMSVVYNSSGILCLEYLNYVYTGGAHGMTGIYYDIIDLNTGQVLSYDQVFIKEAKQELSKLLMAQLRRDNHIPDSVSLTEAGYFTDNIEPAENIYLNGSGMGFTYSLYEIAPYSMGNITVFIEYKYLKDLINTNSPVGQFVKNF